MQKELTNFNNEGTSYYTEWNSEEMPENDVEIVSQVV